MQQLASDPPPLLSVPAYYNTVLCVFCAIKVYLTETGLELWLALLRHATDYDESVHALFPRIPDMLEGDLDNLRQVSCTSRAAIQGVGRACTDRTSAVLGGGGCAS